MITLLTSCCLQVAAKRGQLACVRMLVESAANIFAIDRCVAGVDARMVHA